MRRRLIFEGERGATRFAFVYEALLGYGDGKGERSRAIVRQEARILEALEQVSDPDLSGAVSCPTCGREGNVDMRRLRNGRFELEIAQDDHELLTRYVERRPWLPRVARQAVDVMDWLSAAEKIEA